MHDVRALVTELTAAEAIAWRPMAEAPRDGRWIIALAADRASVFRIGWGREDGSYPSWSSFNSNYGEAFFIGWIPCPQDAPAEVAAALDPDLNCDPDPSSAGALTLGG